MRLLENNKNESQTFREIIRRFDEVLSEKASKHTLVEFRRELDSNYAKLAIMQELRDTVTAMTAKNEKVLAKVFEKLDSASSLMDETVRGITDAQVNKRMKEYERIATQF